MASFYNHVANRVLMGGSRVFLRIRLLLLNRLALGNSPRNGRAGSVLFLHTISGTRNDRLRTGPPAYRYCDSCRCDFLLHGLYCAIDSGLVEVASGGGGVAGGFVLKNINDQNAGVYRKTNVLISGAQHRPPDYTQVSVEMESFIDWYTGAESLHPVERAARMHD